MAGAFRSSKKFVPRATRAAVALSASVLVILGALPFALAEASSGLQPSPVGFGQCDAARFSDGSVSAQIAVRNSTCAVQSTVASGVDGVKGFLLPQGWICLHGDSRGFGLEVGLGVGRHVLRVLVQGRERPGRVQLGHSLHVLADLAPKAE